MDVIQKGMNEESPMLYQPKDGHLGSTLQRSCYQFPNEILLSIFNFLDETDLLKIFPCSKLFNQLALVAHYAKYEILPPFHNLSTGPAFLTGFNLALTTPRLDKLFFTFGPSPTLLKDITRLRLLIDRIPRISEVSLDFGEDILSDDMSDEMKEQLTVLIQRLVLAATGNEGMIIRTSPAGIYLTEPDDTLRPEVNRFSRGPPPRSREDLSADREGLAIAMVLLTVIIYCKPRTITGWLFAFFATFIVAYQTYNRYRARFRPLITTIDGCKGVTKVPCLTAMRTIQIKSISTPFRNNWTSVIFDIDSIRSLFIGQPMPLSYDEWGYVLPLICLPGLARFTVSHPVATIGDIFSFLERHDTIKEFIYSPSQILLPPATFPFNILPRLISLRASPEFIEYIHQTPGVIPTLKKVEFQVHLRQTTFAESTKRALEKMTSRKTDVHLELIVPEDTQHSKWLGDDFENQKQPEYTLPCVKTLSLYWFPTQTASSIPKWLQRFPSLTRLGLMDLDLPREKKLQIMRSLRDSCPYLDILVIGSVELTMEEWLMKLEDS